MRLGETSIHKKYIAARSDLANEANYIVEKDATGACILFAYHDDMCVAIVLTLR